MSPQLMLPQRTYLAILMAGTSVSNSAPMSKLTRSCHPLAGYNNSRVKPTNAQVNLANPWPDVPSSNDDDLKIRQPLAIAEYQVSLTTWI